MNAYVQLVATSFISVAVSGAVLRVLSGPLMNVLCRVCPDEQAATFWLSYTKVMLVIAPLLFVLLVDMFTRVGTPLDSLRFTLMATLGGLLIGLHVIGKRLGQFVKATQPGSGS
ncbi:hypothetical protein [Oryzomicrobium sp.]|uniref:hypothetical protein n=1 Tax=Oryzomicrobium sp. TaxID=1911578 RepID=UPI0025D06313|nr:hypothetical protein [Oryzomicrobium sp.]MCE1243514.1 hypothetical protein [Oryzomicrobium sp.]